MQKLKIILPISVFVLGGLILYWSDFISYDGEVRRFEKRIRRDVNPVALQAWATDLLHTYSASNDLSVSLGSSMFPADIRQLDNGQVFGFVMPNSSAEAAHVRVIWGGGFRGHWGLRVGSTNFVDDGSEMWRPGVYFWREMRR